jgi:hypothetical protein
MCLFSAAPNNASDFVETRKYFNSVLFSEIGRCSGFLLAGQKVCVFGEKVGSGISMDCGKYCARYVAVTYPPWPQPPNRAMGRFSDFLRAAKKRSHTRRGPFEHYP